MHLRDYVRNDDVDLAIRVMLESFVNAQKQSVMKSLRKSFAKYIAFKKDNDALLLYILQNCLRETIQYYQMRNEKSVPSTIDIDCSDFEARVCTFFFCFGFFDDILGSRNQYS